MFCLLQNATIKNGGDITGVYPHFRTLSWPLFTQEIRRPLQKLERARLRISH